MANLFDKSKTYNYIVASVFLLISFWFVKEITYSLWKFNVLNLNHYAFLSAKIINLSAFTSLKYMSLIMVLAGSIFITYGGVLITMSMDFNEIFKRKENDENKEESITSQALKNAKEAVKEDENNKEIIKEEVKDLDPKEEKFSMYNQTTPQIDTKEEVKKLITPEIIKKEEVVDVKPQPIFKEEENNDDEEREKLQAKIRETIEKMKNRTVEKEDDSDENFDKILKPFNPVDVLPKKEISKESSMNFEKISEEDNSKMETTLISAGFKLLSEIRIGKTGIDYLGVAKDKLVVIQFDTTEGNWLASEDKMSGEDAPFWLSDMGNKISPISRVMEAKSDIENLTQDIFNIPVKPVVCLSNSDVVNYFDAIDEWQKNGIEVVRLNESDEDMSPIQKINELFPTSSQVQVDEKDMEKLISILEKAEIPE